MAEVLMPPGVKALRMMLHSTAVEVLLYLTPLHCQDMLNSLVDSINIQFGKFQRRNPSFQVGFHPGTRYIGELLLPFGGLAKTPYAGS